MSSRTSSRSTLTTVPSTMSPSLKYLMVSSIAARKASSEPRPSTETLLVAGVAFPLEVASMLLVMWAVAPVGCVRRPWCARGPAAGQSHRGSEEDRWSCPVDRGSAPYRDRNPRVHRLAYRLHRDRMQALPIRYRRDI